MIRRQRKTGFGPCFICRICLRPLALFVNALQRERLVQTSKQMCAFSPGLIRFKGKTLFVSRVMFGMFSISCLVCETQFPSVFCRMDNLFVLTTFFFFSLESPRKSVRIDSQDSLSLESKAGKGGLTAFGEIFISASNGIKFTTRKVSLHGLKLVSSESLAEYQSGQHNHASKKTESFTSVARKPIDVSQGQNLNQVFQVSYEPMSCLLYSSISA